MGPGRTWEELPPAVRQAVEGWTGPIASVEGWPAPAGHLALVVGSAAGRSLLRAVPVDHPDGWTAAREAAVAAGCGPAAPALRGWATVGGWHLLAYEHLRGRPADLAPWSSDLPAVVDALNALGRRPPPPADLPLWSFAERWGPYLDDPRDVDWFTGDALLHTDWAPANVVVADDEARCTGWAWATRGPAWLDPASWVVPLVAAGHDPDGAEGWATQVTAWSDGPQRALDLFAVAQARHWATAAATRPDPAVRRLADAARAWVAHRRPRPL